MYDLICPLKGRPTEIPEKDIYLNEARYDEEEGQFRKLKGLKVICRFVLLVTDSVVGQRSLRQVWNPRLLIFLLRD